ncbi:MAG: 23S rRNA (uracil(1939)-C(5))-methyltransferase RlmD [Nevskiaceae bacterium]|nr:MAG: 23S rRNA (uracil(1939)-C(5))-methyltransferase RlmD [Nevskiaceae bacterium]TBR74037.1 MAG: 23S rRNA (uracil(1939)-C(5))-methyltransferase RlmD [Nevskiaceae bacterium]
MSRRRSRPLPVEEFTADIADLTDTGAGVARIDGRVVFVAGALPGERVRFRITRMRRGTRDAVVTAVEQPAPDRVVPRCPHFDICGGCALQHLDARRQIEFKQKQLLDALQRIGGVVSEVVAPPLVGPVWAYRRRARLGVRWVHKKNRLLVGFRERATPKLALLSRCEVLDARVGTQLEALGELIAGLSIREQLPQIEVAAAETVALVLRVMQAPTPEDCDRLRAFAAREGFVFYLQPGGPDSVVPLDPPAPELTYSPDGSALTLRFEPLDFVQVNLALSQQMVRQALEWLALRAGEQVLELFCGLGNFSLPLAAQGVRLTAVEGDAALVERARANAARNGLDVHFLKADLFQPDAHAPWLAAPCDAVLLDPPRAGAQEILPFVAKLAPQRILYVSCHPGTLARDAGLLAALGYRLVRAGVMDMFPHTAHVESMALFER